jgi:PAS domain S-box-containing protein
MHWQSTPYVFPVVVAGMISAWLAFAAWQRRRAPGATLFSLLMLAVAQWSLGYALELASADLPIKLFWDNVAWLGAVSAPAVWFAFALHYTGRARWLTRRTLVMLALEPLITLLLVWTNALHHLINSTINLDTGASFSSLVFTYGPWFWVNIAYSYLLLLLGTLLICSFIQTLIRSASLYRGQVGALLLAVAAPWVGNAFTLLGWNPFPRLDLTPFAFTVTGIAMASSLVRFRLLDIRPVAREVLIENMTDALFVLDEQNRLVDLNPAAQRMLGRAATELVGQSALQVFSAWPQLVVHNHSMADVHEEIVVGAGTTEHVFDLRISPLYQRNGHNTLTGYLVILRDITGRKQVERALKEHQDLLLHEQERRRQAAEQLYQQLQTTHQKLCELDHLKDQFLMTVSHELRTPLTSVQGYLELMGQFQERIPPEQQREFLQKARRSCDELIMLLNNVMDVSRLEVEAGLCPAQLTSVSVQDVVQRVITLIEPQLLHEQREIHVHVPPHLYMRADAERLRQVLLNISMNALKYSQPGTPIAFSAHVASDARNAVIINVTDRGNGIAPQDQACVFQRFVRLERDINSPTRGSGLGLFICNRLMECMEGKIWIESTGIAGEGTTFHIQLPMD